MRSTSCYVEVNHKRVRIWLTARLPPQVQSPDGSLYIARSSSPSAADFELEIMALLTFAELGIEIVVNGPKSVLEAALEELIEIRHNCGGLGMCTTCRVQVLEGGASLGPPNEAELSRLGAHRIEKGWRLACQTIMRDDLTIRLPRYP